MRPHGDIAPVDFAAAFSQVTDKLLARVELRARWLVAIKIAHETNPERNVVQIIAVHVAAIDLTPPAIADFDLPVTGRCSVPNHKVIGETILHPSHVPMVVIEHACVSLSRAAIVHHNELPSAAFHRRAPDRFDD